MKIPILATGFSGLVGTRLSELLFQEFDFEDMSYTTGVDITNTEQVMDFVGKSEASVLIHMAAKADVDGCEDDKLLQEEGAAWQVNVVGTQNICLAAKKYSKRLIYISTDFVFDGTKDSYTEQDTPNPVNWYGYTKYMGEESIKEAGVSFAILRIAYPYRAQFETKKDFVRRILARLKGNEKIFAIKDHIITPTFIDDIAFAMKAFLDRSIEGTYHVVGSDSMSILEAIKLIGHTFGYKPDLIETTRDHYFKDKAFRPFKLALKNDKIRGLGIKMHTFRKGLEAMSRQLSLL